MMLEKMVQAQKLHSPGKKSEENFYKPSRSTQGPPSSMSSLDISRGEIAILQDLTVLNDLPSEILEILRRGNSPRYLDAIAASSLIPSLTVPCFARFESVFADTCSRWVSHERNHDHYLATIQAFARVLPFAPHLSVLLDKYLRTPLTHTQGSSRQEISLRYLSENSQDELFQLSDLNIQRLLLAAFRLLKFDKSTFCDAISACKVQTLLRHPNRPVKYLAVRVICQLLSISDVKLEEMISEHVGNTEAVMGDFDGNSIDYGFLSLYEQKRVKEVAALQKSLQEFNSEPTPSIPEGLSPLVSCFGEVLLPRPNGSPARPTILVPTRTTSENLQNFAQALLSSSPILIHGLSGAGKTSIVNDFARELGKDSSMITLHLNEQTDAKMLIGMYTTDATPGSFSWRPGVLTTAVKEGRWVFIEDLDRAPNEVISVVLPLIERREMIIPSRSETVHAASGFRLIASIRTTLNMAGTESPPSLNMLGARLWNRVPIRMPARDEFLKIIDGIYPLLRKFLPGIMGVYGRLYTVSQKPSFVARSRTSLGRPISPRDLFKWCRRIHAVLSGAGSKSGDEPISEATKDEMFMEAADCFAGSLQTEEARRSIISSIAEEMHIPPQRVEHYFEAYVPSYEDSQAHIVIGRAKLRRRKASSQTTKASKKSRPFATTTSAKRLLEQVGVAVKMAEPVLLVGETGIGKTTVIQQLADSLGYKLTVVNLSQQSEVGDLLGGFKPVNVRSLAVPLKEEFDELFASTGLSATKNQKYLDQLGKCIAKGQWTKVSKLWREAPRMFEKILSEILQLESARSRDAPEQPTKRRKTESKLQMLLNIKPRWKIFSESLDQFDIQLSGGSNGFAFSFMEGNIVKAARNGGWVLLDEINLASPDTLESIADLLNSGPGNFPSILLSEKGEIERVQAHQDFRIFGAMNPATDVGKRDLPMGLRSRFSEFYVESPDRDLDDLLAVIRAYLRNSSSSDERAAHDVARLYMNTKRLADQKRLVDGANQIPHFSLRTLTRVLSYVTDIAPSYGLRRALYEGYAMGFLTLLDRESEKLLVPLINFHLLDSHPNPRALLSQTPQRPNDGRQYVPFKNQKGDRQYWMLQGREIPQEQPHYIITPFVERNMLNLVRATSTRRFPVLVQGPTSSGKTSMIEYLAKHSGNRFVRINNHEHTDLQEYMGTYVSGSDGHLRFQEGLLVQALREGHWIVLDELNLAPTDVLEALNRLLDDNREFFVPETQEVVRPHENFMLFATQNPPGLYGGRKTLSRAFRNRFLELHFDDIPEDELEYILENRSQKVAPSDCRRIVTVYKDLSRLRQSNRLFEQKDSFATLRDLFRWALRDADNREQLAANGYMLLAERVRKPEERVTVREIIEKVMKVELDPKVLYDAALSPEIRLYEATENTQGVVWTHAMRRLYVLVSHALRNNEPVLLVGETGCGKTTVCQMLADAFGKQLHVVNAHQNTETGDLIGAQRPVRNRASILTKLEEDLRSVLQISEGDVEKLIIAYDDLDNVALANIPNTLRNSIQNNRTKAKALFEWSDGTLVQAMKEGQFFLLDEISLADDSVLERLNSVLELQRSLLLAEKGSDDSFVLAKDGFQFLATMNPGGDYGKRELSPALRNRFTEIWVPSMSDHDDVFQIVEAKLKTGTKHFAKALVDFADWFGHRYRTSATQSISVRDVLAWVTFINTSNATSPYFAVLHGAAMVYIDTLGANPTAQRVIRADNIHDERNVCLHQLGLLFGHDVASIYSTQIKVTNSEHALNFGKFSIERNEGASLDETFAFDAPTTMLNAMRVVRALQVQKPILIEGSPGVGKTTLIAALAKATGKHLTRINLSEQTDLMDLFGSDIPVEGAEAGVFAWRDAPFLQAMQNGDWVLLDEMNLASQSVLEGLNACLDHRGEVYISELDQTFKRHPKFCVFAAQNPHHQGGGRKGLPSSFVNRFTVVYADVFRNEDLTLICTHNFPNISHELMAKIITFVSTLEEEVLYKKNFGSQGGPWEFNLRDTLRWLQLLSSQDPFLQGSRPSDFLNLVFRQRFRTLKDREQVDTVFSRVFGFKAPFRHLFHNLSPEAFQVGMGYLARNPLVQRLPFPGVDIVPHLPVLESMLICIQQNLPCVLVGPSGCGKSALIEHAAAAVGAEVVIFPLNSEIDTMDLVGGFEQVDPNRLLGVFLKQLHTFLETQIIKSMPCDVPVEALRALDLCQSIQGTSQQLLAQLHECLLSLQCKSSLTELDQYLITFQHMMQGPQSIGNARFEWVDGVLVKALEEGRWLVLDSANLCSSSVLDRLNSLLEPHGVLSINEHCGLNGEPKVIQPHPGFRLFLTMDPRFGELSRAMRNRSIEIYVDAFVDFESFNNPGRPREIHVEASLKRYDNLVECLNAPSTRSKNYLLANVALDNLSIGDTCLLPRFFDASQNGLVSGLEPNVHRLIQLYFEAVQCGVIGTAGDAVSDMYDMLAKTIQLRRPEKFKDAQIVHTLQNSPLIPVLQQTCGSELAHWLGSMLELHLELLAGRDSCQFQAESLASLKPSQMNRLQRSLARSRLPAAAKDSTSLVASFLMGTLETLKTHLLSKFSRPKSKQYSKALRNIMRFWWETYELTSNLNFDDATFQALIAIGGDVNNDLITSQPSASDITDLALAFRSQLKQAFESGFSLSTGLSMEKLWLWFRPIPIAKTDTLQVLFDMENLATRFDALRWRASISVPDLANVMTSLINAYKLVMTSDVDGRSLIRDLNSELDSLETNISKIGAAISPYLSIQFEALRQYFALHNATLGTSEIIILSGFPTTSLMDLASSSTTSKALQSVNFNWSDERGLLPLQDSFAASLLQRLHRVGDVSLGSLRLLEAELPIMGHNIVQHSSLLCKNPVLAMNEVLSKLMSEAIDAHGISIVSQRHRELGKLLSGPETTSEVQITGIGLVSDLDLGPGLPKIDEPSGKVPSYLQSIIGNRFDPAALAIAAAASQPELQLQFTSIAWISFALGCMSLYVPDRAFDPDKRQRLERQRHEKFRISIMSRIEALRQFERMFSGQNSNLRCQLLELELEDLGAPKEALQEIFRPAESEIPQLQGEFNNLLSTIYRAEPDKLVFALLSSKSEIALQGIKLLQNNVVQIIRRLSERFRAYRDMTVPVIGMLRCLQIGLSIAGLVSVDNAPNKSRIMKLSKMTPFLGGSLDGRTEEHEDQPMDLLAQIEAIATVEGTTSFNLDQRKVLFEVFHSCYDQWTRQLDADRKEAESRTGIYRFRGSAADEEEDDQEQFNELFPSYDEGSSDSKIVTSSAQTVRDSAITLAKIHSGIFTPTATPEEHVFGLVRQMATRIGSLYEDNMAFASGRLTHTLLPGSLLKINDELDALGSVTSTGDTYNFYIDANLPEARKLVELVHQIQTRFSQLQRVDEIRHMQPLEDVKVSCRELLDFKHVEPLAKIITKVEKIHTFMHEWQFGGWASRTNSALELYNSLTATIVSWRRLELTTWSRIFDMEKRSCDDDAKSWWYIAYQVIIAAPLSRVESESEMRDYAQQLLRDLETYFATAIQGQFSQRLKLLKQLQQHLNLLALDFSVISIVSTALANFIEIYSRYEATVVENIRKGRLILEKKMRDVLLLASWKDTNIAALRDSAKRSHHKLFKLVRKYRSVLGQPMEEVLKLGLPEEPENWSDRTDLFHSTHFPAVNTIALEVCQTLIPGWSQKNKRFLNISRTVNMMDKISQVPSSTADTFTYIEEFIANIISSTTQLNKSTPSVLTEENKATVKHLKSQKRKLFADTLKDLRRMGVKHNLGSTALSEQASLSIILSNTGHVPSETMDVPQGMVYYYHKTLDIISRARAAARQPSEDLTSAEIVRSTGILEGLLQLVIKQRNALAVSMSEWIILDAAVKKMQSLWAPDKHDIRSLSYDFNHSTVLKWLPNILKVGLELTKIHSKLGRAESTDAQMALLSWLEKVNILGKEWEKLPLLPENIMSTSASGLALQVDKTVQALGVDLERLTNDHPNLQYILRPIQPWTETKTTPISRSQTTGDISMLSQKLSKVSDSILVAIEKLSNSVAGLSSSTENPAWLMKNDSCLLEHVRVLNNVEITNQLNQTFRLLGFLDLEDEAISKAAGAVFAVALPIFQQYSKISSQSLVRYAQLHRSTCKMTYILSKIFIQIASQGFCTPSEKSAAQDGKADKLEGGTGLGEGEGAEDISKDIQDDEDLSELAQEPIQNEQEDIEDEKDAVDMADADMEGEMGNAEETGDDEKEDSDNENKSGDDIDEEAGNVDDLDPNAVDEKMWDGDGEKADKEQEGDESKGQPSKDEQTSAQENSKQTETSSDNQEEDEEEEIGAEQSEDVLQEEAERNDPHTQEGETLELPEDMELDGEEREGSVSGSEDGMDELADDVNDKHDGEDVVDEGIEDAENAENAENADGEEDHDMFSEFDVSDVDNGKDESDKTEELREDGEAEDKDFPPESQEGLLHDKTDDAKVDPENIISSDVHGTGQEQDDNPADHEDSSISKAQREAGNTGGDSVEEKNTATDDGEKGRQANGDALPSQNEESQDSAEAQPFKKLGDALEKWHRQQAQIQKPPENPEKLETQPIDLSGDNTQFQHLQDEEADADTQALGTATEDQAHTLDESMAIDSETNALPEAFQPNEAEVDRSGNETDVNDEEEGRQPDHPAYEGRAGAMIQRAKTSNDQKLDNSLTQEEIEFEEDVEEVDTQFSTTHIQDIDTLAVTRSASDAHEQWTHYESLTRDLSLSLTEQLRLILAPTLATKMRGDFRSGKRLNIKRIIPYIASQFKRDKIWMRRSVPSRRSYQILLAVDDSKSMGESGSGSLALETLVMVSKSLSMLEVGEICVVGFGEKVHVIRDFETSFNSDAGPKMLQNFGFGQSRTDVTKLIRESIELFRAARLKASGSPQDLWQLELIISDGLCHSSEHEPIRRLLREAIEERIMIVFVIVDDVKDKKTGESVVDLKEAKFVKDEMTGVSNVKIERYLDTFPFQYYLIVSDVRELPGVLATLLRQWFAEVADSSG